MTPQDLQKAEQALKLQDPILGAILDAQALSVVEDRGDYFEALCRSIIGQQVSVAAARTIFNRFTETTGYLCAR